METYRMWAPTGFDPRGLNANYLGVQDDPDDPGRSEWFVVPVIRTRDSGCRETSNFAAALDLLGGESDTVEVHRFGHWGPGWFEIIIIHPSREADGQSVEDRLAYYPVLDEHDLSQREDEARYDYWRFCSLRERVTYCQDAGESPFAARRIDDIPKRVYDRLPAD